MGILNSKIVKNRIIMLAIFICITFIFYRIVDVSINSNYMFQQNHRFQQNQMTSNVGINSYISVNHTIVSNTLPIFSVDVTLTFDKYFGEDKASIFNLITLIATFIMIHLIFIQLFFLYVRRWLIKTILILERYYQRIISYVHRKDGKKKCYPSYVYC